MNTHVRAHVSMTAQVHEGDQARHVGLYVHRESAQAPTGPVSLVSPLSPTCTGVIMCLWEGEAQSLDSKSKLLFPYSQHASQE